MYLPTVMMLALDEERRLNLERRGTSERRRLRSARQPQSRLGLARWARAEGDQSRVVAVAGARP